MITKINWDSEQSELDVGTRVWTVIDCKNPSNYSPAVIDRIYIPNIGGARFILHFNGSSLEHMRFRSEIQHMVFSPEEKVRVITTPTIVGVVVGFRLVGGGGRYLIKTPEGHYLNPYRSNELERCP